MTIGTVPIGQAAKTIETLALCLDWVCSSFLLQSVQADEIVTVIGGAKVLSRGSRAWPVCMVLGSDQICRTSCVSSIAFHPSTIVKMWLDLCETLVWSPSFFLPAIPKSTSKSRYASRSYKCNKSVNSGQCLKYSTDTTCAYVPHLQSKANHRRVCRILYETQGGKLHVRLQYVFFSVCSTWSHWAWYFKSLFIKRYFSEKLAVHDKLSLQCDHTNMTICIPLDLDVLCPLVRARLGICDNFKWNIILL